MEKELEIKSSSTVVIVGKRNEGKSFLAKYLLCKMIRQEIVDVVYIFSTTETLSHSFDCIPKECVRDNFDIGFIEKILEAQEKKIRKSKIGKDDPKIAKILFIFDDLLGSVRQGSKEQQLLNKLFATSRHLKVGLMVLSQTTRGLFSPALRQNTDYLFFRKVNENQLPSLFEAMYFSGTYKEFVQFYKNATNSSKFGFLCYDNLTREDDKYFLITAEETDFKIKYTRKISNPTNK